MSVEDFVNGRIRVSLSDIFGDTLVCRFAYMLYSAVSIVAKFVHKDNKRYRYAYRNNRYVNPRYYAKYKHLDFPRGKKWVLVTLTLSRDIDLIAAWSNIGLWVSRFLHNLRSYSSRKGVKVSYFWVIEPHKDGYPHVHILVSFPFLPLEKLQSWWSYSEAQGVDVRFIGSDYEQVKNYVLKYLLKAQYVDFHIDFKERYIEFGLIPFLLWANRVRLLGRSRGFTLKELKREREWFYIGTATFKDDVVYDVREAMDSLKLDYDTHELKSLLVSFLQHSGLVFEYKSFDPSPYRLDYEIPDDALDF